MHLDQSHQIW